MASKTPTTKAARSASVSTTRRPKTREAPKAVPQRARRAVAAPRKRTTKAPELAALPAPQTSKQGLLLNLLRSSAGATVTQMAEATGWQHHTIRGTISGVLRKKMKLNVVTEKGDGGAVYRIVESSPAA